MWRTGHKVPINVYDGDTPVCQCQNAAYAAVIVVAVNEQLEKIRLEELSSFDDISLDNRIKNEMIAENRRLHMELVGLRAEMFRCIEALKHIHETSRAKAQTSALPEQDPTEP